ncbi:8755_t:CDS:2 [Acaulospora morrowiae]|uniref:8755_t:CDS:1 n=1 Tax=Acaulospora morrowiae TaxID=94023 RepID=A0A9N9C514_9GLOM|nr:8755_t:CDS:2 [Acaulospora morrowiae]
MSALPEMNVLRFVLREVMLRVLLSVMPTSTALGIISLVQMVGALSKCDL